MKRPARKVSLTGKSAVADQQILALHKLMADKLLAEPWRILTIREKLEQRYQSGQLRHSAYIHWHCILDSINNAEQFRAALLSDAETMVKLRRRTILTGVLTEAERMPILNGAGTGLFQ